MECERWGHRLTSVDSDGISALSLPTRLAEGSTRTPYSSHSNPTTGPRDRSRVREIAAFRVREIAAFHESSGDYSQEVRATAGSVRRPSLQTSRIACQCTHRRQVIVTLSPTQMAF